LVTTSALLNLSDDSNLFCDGIGVPKSRVESFIVDWDDTAWQPPTTILNYCHTAVLGEFQIDRPRAFRLYFFAFKKDPTLVAKTATGHNDVYALHLSKADRYLTLRGTS
jgi:hypothetical protein